MVPLEGPVGIGALIDAILLGCAIVQSCVYYKNNRGDTWSLKILLIISKVFLILFVLLSQIGSMAAWLWAGHKASIGDEFMPNYANILFGISSICGAVVLFFERSFFSFRIMKAFRNHQLTFLYLLFCIFALTAALGAASLFFTSATADLTHQLSSTWIFPLGIITGLFCDLAINVATAFYLQSQTPTGIADTLGCAVRLLFWVAETGAVTSLSSICIMVVYLLTRTSFAWLGLLVIMPGVFVNAFLLALNVRGHLCADIQHQRGFGIGEQLIEKRPKKPSIKIVIKDKQSEKSPV